MRGVRSMVCACFDLTRVLAGPACGRTLASYGADVLNVRAERLDTIEMFDLDTGQGKHSAFLDLVKPADAETMRRLVRDAHVFVGFLSPRRAGEAWFHAGGPRAYRARHHLCVGVVLRA